MLPNISLKGNSLTDNFFNSILQFDSPEITNLELQIQNSIDNIFETIPTNQNDQPNSTLNNSGAIATGQEDDLVLGIATSLDNLTNPDTSNLGIINTGLIRTSVGNDRVIGSAETIIEATNQASTRTIAIGVQNQGLIDTGNDDDQVLGIAKAQANSVNEIVSLGLINTGRINTGSGNDTIIGQATAINDNNTSENNADTIAIGVQNQGFLQTGEGDDNISGIAEIEASSLNKTISLGITNTGLIRTGIGNDTITGKAINNAIATSSNDNGENEISTLAIGVQNQGLLETADGNDRILGVATATSSSESTITPPIELSSDDLGNAIALSNAVVAINTSALAIGIQNTGAIETGRDEDQIIGIANTESLISLEVNSQVDLELGNNSFAIAESEITSNIGAFAIGLENQGKIGTGQGDDYLIGVAGTLAVNDLEVSTIANNIFVASGSDFSPIEEIEEIRTAQSNSVAVGVNQTTTLGIVNTGLIDTGIDNDLVFGLASNTSSSEIEVTSIADSVAQGSAIAIATIESLAVAQGFAIGIANSGTIRTGRGDDLVIGIASNQASANVEADAIATSNSSVTDAQSSTDVIADVSETIAIGIDNNSGSITTAEGDDQIIGLGNVGITGGSINTGQDNDRVIAYGDIVGVEGSTIELGQGDDFFKAAIVTVDPLTSEILQPEDQSDSIIDTSVWGGSGNDTFEIGGFAGDVVIDGGLDHDVLRLGGNFDDYQISLGSAENQSLSLDNAESTLTVRNVEEFQFTNSDRIYSYSDFA